MPVQPSQPARKARDLSTHSQHSHGQSEWHDMLSFLFVCGALLHFFQHWLHFLWSFSHSSQRQPVTHKRRSWWRSCQALQKARPSDASCSKRLLKDASSLRLFSNTQPGGRFHSSSNHPARLFFSAMLIVCDCGFLLGCMKSVALMETMKATRLA